LIVFRVYSPNFVINVLWFLIQHFGFFFRHFAKLPKR